VRGKDWIQQRPWFFMKAYMKEVFSSADSGIVGLYQTLLEQAGIATFVRNSGTQQSVVAGLATALLPLPIFYPTLCVVNDEDHAEAVEILRTAKRDADTPQVDWVCPKCGESVPGNFTSCWKCEQPRDSDTGKTGHE